MNKRVYIKKSLLFYLITIIIINHLLFGDSDSADAYYDKANQYYINGKFCEAMEYYTKAIMVIN